MVITGLETLEKSKVKVYIDQEFAFLLYQKEVEQYSLEEGTVLTGNIYDCILEDTILPRAKQKALNLLKFSDRSEQELTTKLKEALYPMMVVEKVIAYVKEYGYLNDERFASSYIRSRMSRKSKRVIMLELQNKGIKNQLLEKIITEVYQYEESDPEEEAIKKAIHKKIMSPDQLSYEDKQKLIASLYRKGFDLDKIKKILK